MSPSPDPFSASLSVRRSAAGGVRPQLLGVPVPTGSSSLSALAATSNMVAQQRPQPGNGRGADGKPSSRKGGGRGKWAKGEGTPSKRQLRKQRGMGAQGVPSSPLVASAAAWVPSNQRRR